MPPLTPLAATMAHFPVLTISSLLLLLPLTTTTPPAAATATPVNCTEIYDNYIVPCIDYVVFGGSIPGYCCTSIKSFAASLNTTDVRRDACRCLKSVVDCRDYLKGINAVHLPTKCGVDMPPGFDLYPTVDCSRTP